MMKNIFSIVVLIVVFSFTSIGYSKITLRWRYDGTVSNEVKTTQIKLQNIYHGFPVSGGIYLAGYEITSDGLNLPYAAFVSDDLSESIYWAQEASIVQFFKYQNSLYLLDEDGGLQVLDSNKWSKGRLLLRPNSIVVYSSGYIVACNPAPLRKNSSVKGGCYSPQKKWQVDMSWRKTIPTVCGKHLIIVEDFHEEKRAYQLDLETGKLIKSLRLKDPSSEEALCKLSISK